LIEENAMFRFSSTDTRYPQANRFGVMIAAALIASFAATNVYANQTQTKQETSSQPTTGSRIPAAKRETEKDNGVIEVIMIGAVLEPGDAADVDDANDETPALPMIRADNANTSDGAQR
jgi:hypothetical protein